MGDWGKDPQTYTVFQPNLGVSRSNASWMKQFILDKTVKLLQHIDKLINSVHSHVVAEVQLEEFRDGTWRQCGSHSCINPLHLLLTMI